MRNADCVSSHHNFIAVHWWKSSDFFGLCQTSRWRHQRRPFIFMTCCTWMNSFRPHPVHSCSARCSIEASEITNLAISTLAGPFSLRQQRALHHQATTSPYLRVRPKDTTTASICATKGPRALRGPRGAHLPLQVPRWTSKRRPNDTTCEESFAPYMHFLHLCGGIIQPHAPR